MKKLKKILIGLTIITASLVFQAFPSTDFSQKNNEMELTEKYPFIKDAYKITNQTSVSDQLWAYFFPLSFLIGKGISYSIISNRDERIGNLLYNYDYDKHSEYMNKIIQSEDVKEQHKAQIIGLATEYKDFRKNLDRDYYAKMKNLKRTNNQNNVIEFEEIPYMEQETLNQWINNNYEKENNETIMKAVNDYKYLRRLGDNKLNVLYFEILHS